MADILTTLAIVAACSAAYCFIVGEITLNNSQMDKLWSILPAVYVWIVAIKGGMSPRLVLMASLATIWGVRLTWNFARKGAYSWKFWAGEEDYRWKWLLNRSRSTRNQLDNCRCYPADTSFPRQLYPCRENQRIKVSGIH